MYGDIIKAGDRRPNIWVLDFGIPIPHEHLKDEVVMYDMRNFYMFNPDMPGAIENVHPNKFIADLRPVEEFWHTPVIPISEKDLSEYKRKVEEANRRGYTFELKKDSIYYWSIVTMMFVIIIYVFLIFSESTSDLKYQMDKGKYYRIQ